MKVLSKRKIKNVILGFVWVLAACGSIVLLVAAVRKNDKKECKGVNVHIAGVSNHYFIDKNDVEQIIQMYEGDQKVGKPIANFDLDNMENALQRNIWIKDAQIYFDNHGMLQVEITEREPVARIFTKGGSSFYIDSTLMMLPLSDKLSARLPVFTGFPSDAAVLHKRDSSLLEDVKTISLDIQADPFLNSMIDQVDITMQRQFEMIPKIGNQLIVFGDASDSENKFRKLKLFYKNVITKVGWNKYSAINLQYKDQVVGKIRGADDVSADSLRTIQLMQLIAENTERMSADTSSAIGQENEKNATDSVIILHSIQRDEVQEPTIVTMPDFEEHVALTEMDKDAPPVKIVTKSVTKPVVKPVTKKALKPLTRATMPSAKKKPTEVKKARVAASKKPAAVKKPVNNDY